MVHWARCQTTSAFTITVGRLGLKERVPSRSYGITTRDSSSDFRLLSLCDVSSDMTQIKKCYHSSRSVWKMGNNWTRLVHFRIGFAISPKFLLRVQFLDRFKPRGLLKFFAHDIFSTIYVSPGIGKTRHCHNLEQISTGPYMTLITDKTQGLLGTGLIIVARFG